MHSLTNYLLQILTRVLGAWTCVPLMPLVPTLRETTTAHVTLDTKEMDSHATVSNVYNSITVPTCNLFQILMSVSLGPTLAMQMPLVQMWLVVTFVLATLGSMVMEKAVQVGHILLVITICLRVLSLHTDVDECATTSGLCVNAECSNSAGSYVCLCHPGFSQTTTTSPCGNSSCHTPICRDHHVMF